MVVKITTPLSIKRALNYNHQKEQNGLALCLHAENFLKEAHEMNFYEKLARFERNLELNARAKTNTLHISLNFSNTDPISQKQMVAVAKDYMEAIGFKEQPYLIYQHLDAGHPHLHLVTTNIKNDGKRIDTFNIAKLRSEPARKALEIKYGLVKAGEQVIAGKEEVLQPPRSIHYGKAETKRAITNVLEMVLSKYQYASLPELNALLGQYNIVADRGREDGIIYKHAGLTYRILDKEGNKIGMPIKASAIYSKPTLKNLQIKFDENKLKKRAFISSAKSKLDRVLKRRPDGLNTFREQLKAENISLVIRRNDKGVVYGLTYIDHNNKCVFNGSELGKDYSANQILAAVRSEQSISPASGFSLSPKQFQAPAKLLLSNSSLKPGLAQAVKDLLEPEQIIQAEPKEFKKKKRKRSR